ncbi:PrsW family intramembrane metalloprotease [Streptomyces marincola]|uniref:PrsW family intramembrane metalloprotease n=1 Tax=Streptomyces marincola TaxID=2878388 RepID=UPI001CF18274|nr:PrsW family intramembrane metalloprotease [Streptomyces marincola]UCM88799.1 PrsW family intramembrane metalloprotease [Streptomyces marincola]
MRATRSPTVLIGAPLLVCGLVVMALVWRDTDAAGLWGGLGLALLPVPFLVGAFHWLDALAPRPWRALAFAFGWGACAATLFALLANGLLVELLTDQSASLRTSQADQLELTVIAPVVEETAKAAGVLLLFLHLPREFNGVLSGIVAGGITGAGFAFTENVVYLGHAIARDQVEGVGGVDSATTVTFFVRIVVGPFAHPVFTVLAGIGLGLAFTWARDRPRWRRALPLAGLGAAMVLHSVWNASASMTLTGFVLVYALLMVPVFCLLCWLAVRERDQQLRAVRRTLPQYAAAGWFAAAEPAALGSLRSRSLSRRLARQRHGSAGLRAVVSYQTAATSLAVLRDRAEHGLDAPYFADAERELLLRVGRHRALAAASIEAAASSGTTAVPGEPSARTAVATG